MPRWLIICKASVIKAVWAVKLLTFCIRKASNSACKVAVVVRSILVVDWMVRVKNLLELVHLKVVVWTKLGCVCTVRLR
jgi:hypothetical protein